MTDGYRHCLRGDIMLLGCHMISQDHLKMSFNPGTDKEAQRVIFSRKL